MIETINYLDPMDTFVACLYAVAYGMYAMFRFSHAVVAQRERAASTRKDDV